jgi:hypothetical protein
MRETRRATRRHASKSGATTHGSTFFHTAYVGCSATASPADGSACISSSRIRASLAHAPGTDRCHDLINPYLGNLLVRSSRAIIGAGAGRVSRPGETT